MGSSSNPQERRSLAIIPHPSLKAASPSEQLPPPPPSSDQNRHRSLTSSTSPAQPSPSTPASPCMVGPQKPPPRHGTRHHQIDSSLSKQKKHAIPAAAAASPIAFLAAVNTTGGTCPPSYTRRCHPRCAPRDEVAKALFIIYLLLSQAHHPLPYPKAMRGQPALGSSRISLALPIWPIPKRESPQRANEPKREQANSCLFMFSPSPQAQPTTAPRQQAQRPLSGWRLRAAGFHRAVPRRPSQSIPLARLGRATRHASATRRAGFI